MVPKQQGRKDKPLKQVEEKRAYAVQGYNEAVSNFGLDFHDGTLHKACVYSRSVYLSARFTT